MNNVITIISIETNSVFTRWVNFYPSQSPFSGLVNAKNQSFAIN